MKIIITPLAQLTFFDEQDYILTKWNKIEVEKFIDLVASQVELLSKGLVVGSKIKNTNVREWVISKQTSVFYRINNSQNELTIILFWNHQQSPSRLNQILKRL